jgi:DNA polymerase I-like protein with 3'-5' exonuclease and polymerase domains
MKQLFKEGWSLHAEAAKEIYGGSAGADGRTEPYYTLAKKGRHLWNYGGKARTMAASLGILVVEAEKIIKRLEHLHPGVVAWHRRIGGILKASAPKDRVITNAFGYRITYFGRPGENLTDALAWIGQGTVACTINRVMDNIDAAIAKVEAYLTEFLMQQHDSLVGQTHSSQWDIVKPMLREQFTKVVIPYEDPLVIPPDLKTSRTHWGAMTKEKWQ